MSQNNSIVNFKVTPLTMEELRLKAPSAFATSPMNGLSTRYTFVPTTEIVAGLRQKDWVPVNVEQQRVRSESRFGFQKHLIRFRRNEQMQTLDEWNAELVLTNSHDAGCAYILQVGIYRRLCSNGLVVSEDSFQAIRFRHSGLRAQEVVQASYRVLEYGPQLGTLIDRLRSRILDEDQALAFAHQALLLRYQKQEQSPIRPITLLTPRRVEDQSNDLWTVLNRVQENLLQGGLSDGRRTQVGTLRTLRSLRGIDSKVSINKKLWSLAEQTAKCRN
jgi:hypothetical protein